MPLKFKLNLTNSIFLLVSYLAFTFWIHHLTKDISTINQLRQYVVARCTSKQSIEVEEQTNLLKCQGLQIKIKGVWGGFYGKPNVHLKVTYPDDGTSEDKYYSLKISPLYGFSSVGQELRPEWYYLNL